MNEVTQEGLPVLFVKDIPPVTSVPKDIDIKEPSIYVGEVSNESVIVDTHAHEFHYSRGDDNVETRYSGKDGVRISSLWRKLLFSVGFQSLQILFSNDITPESRVLYHRNLTDRVTTIANFLQYDDDPYMVVSEGRLFWIRDATRQRPVRIPRLRQRRHYIRNSVKVVVDAYNGTCDYYLADPGDPWRRRSPDLLGFLKPLDLMPADLRKHLRYPETIFAIQAAIDRMHMTNRPCSTTRRTSGRSRPSTARVIQAMQPYLP